MTIDRTMVQAGITQAHELLRASQGDAALATLQGLLTALEMRTFEGIDPKGVYVHVWALSTCGRYEEAANLLLPKVDPASEEGQALQGTDRRRIAPVSLLLGLLALQVEAGHVETVMHFARCLSALDERRMNLPVLRIRLLCGWARMSLSHQLYADAYALYSSAARSCNATEGDEAKEVCQEIMMGLCESALKCGKSRDALLYGLISLPFLRVNGDALSVVRVLTWLGDALRSVPEDSLRYYEEALQNVSDPNLKARIHGKMAERKLQLKAFQGARQAAQIGVALFPLGSQEQGQLCRIIGDSFLAEVSAEREHADHSKLSFAFYWYMKAKDTCENQPALLADISLRLAELSLAIGMQRDASVYLRQALRHTLMDDPLPF